MNKMPLLPLMALLPLMLIAAAPPSVSISAERIKANVATLSSDAYK